MIGHIIKLIWNKKGSNSLMLLELILSFLVLFSAISYVLFNYDRLSLPLGFETKNKWMIYLDSYDDRDSIEVAEIQNKLYLELSQMPNIKSVAFSHSVTPYSQSTWQSSSDDMGFEITSRFIYVDEHFGQNMKLKVLKGRWFNEQDYSAAYEPMIVNERFINEYFPEKDMIDSIIDFNGEHKLVGVVEDYRYGGKFEEHKNTSFFLNARTDKMMQSVYLDLEDNTPVSFEAEVNRLVEEVTKSSSFVIQDLETLAKRSDRENWIPIIALLVISGFLCINVSLGLFGILWYTINKRKAEIGLRRAMGASPGNIATQFTLEIIVLSCFALIVGLFFAIQVPLLKLFPIDSSIFYRAIAFSIVIILGIVTLCAIYPSSQASKILPATALHEE